MKPFVPHFIIEQYKNKKFAGSFKGFALFIDLKGFTQLTNTIIKQGADKVEQLSVVLNGIFEPLVSIVYEREGFIPYFAGDAFTGIFPATKKNTAKDILATADLIRDLFVVGGLRELGLDEFPISAKIGISYGKIEWGIIQSSIASFYFKGEAIEKSAKSQTLAHAGEIVIDEHFFKQLEGASDFTTPLANGFHKINEVPHFLEYADFDNSLPTFPREDQLNFLPLALQNMDDIGELRYVVSIFISFKEGKNKQATNDFISIVIEQFQNFGGYFKEIDYGDKGGVLVGFFGAPIAYEDNQERALECMLAIKQESADLCKFYALKFKAGITFGLVYAGIIGGEQRCQYALVGNAVNLAARIMVAAQWGDILVDETLQKDIYFHFRYKNKQHFKGIAEDVTIYELLGSKLEVTPRYHVNMVGREHELKTLKDFCQPIFNKKFGGICHLFGEAGMGKTRLTFELENALLKQANLHWFVCQADQILQKPFNPFIYFLKNYFQQDPQLSLQQNQKIFEQVFEKLLHNYQANNEQLTLPYNAALFKELVRTKPILATLMGLLVKKSIWEQLDAKGRYQNTISAISNLLLVLSSINPTIIELEDAHWFDNSSKAFLQDFLRAAPHFPLLLLVTSRYADDGSKALLFEKSILERDQIPHLELNLEPLSIDMVRHLAQIHLKSDIHPDFLEVLQRTSTGNPFYVEQTLDYFQESGLILQKNGVWELKEKEVKITGSVRDILIARIDRLSKLVKETVKTAAVIGREFEVQVLSEVMLTQADFARENGNTQKLLTEQIRTAEQGQIWKAINELKYMFSHSLLREAAYDMQLKTRVRKLHQAIAVAIEKIFSENLKEKYSELAFHYEQAGNKAKTDLYLEKVALLAEQNFQNARAIAYYDKLLDNLQQSSHTSRYIHFLLKKGNIQELIGEWENCEKTYQLALKLAQSSGDKELLGKANNSLGNLYTLKGEYEPARLHLEISAAFFEDIKDEVGQYMVYGNLGNVLFRQGQYEEAIGYFLQSISLAQENNHTTLNSKVVANLGLTYMNLGKYDEAIQHLLPHLQLCEQAEYKQGIATISINLGILYAEKGDLKQAMTFYQQGLQESEALDDMLLTSIALGSIGSIYTSTGKYDLAQSFLDKDLQICERLGDKQGTAIAFGLLGDLNNAKGNMELAIKQLSKQLALCQELNYQKGIIKAHCSLGDSYYNLDDWKQAEKHLSEAIRIANNIKNKNTLAYAHLLKTNIAIKQMQWEEAHHDVQIVLQISHEIGNNELHLLARAFLLKIKHFLETPASTSDWEKLIQAARNEKELAYVYYSAIATTHATESALFREKATHYFETLYQLIPKFAYQRILQELRTKTINF